MDALPFRQDEKLIVGGTREGQGKLRERLPVHLLKHDGVQRRGGKLPGRYGSNCP